MKYTVGYVRSQGIECKWSKNSRGAPIIIGKVPNPGKVKWAVIDANIWKEAEKQGLKQAFENATVLIDFFSVPC